MEDLDINLDELKLDEGIFQDVKFYVSGQVHEKVFKLHKSLVIIAVWI